MGILPTTSPAPLFTLEWLEKNGGATLIESAIRTTRWKNKDDSTRALLQALMLSTLMQPNEAIQALSSIQADSPLELARAALTIKSEEFLKNNERLQAIWHAYNASIISYNRGDALDAMNLALKFYMIFCHGSVYDDNYKSDFEKLIINSRDAYNNQLVNKKNHAIQQADLANLQAAMLAGEDPDTLTIGWNRIVSAGLQHAVTDLFHQSVIGQLGQDPRTPTQLYRWFEFLESHFTPDVAQMLESVTAWYMSQPPEPQPDLHAELARSWWLRHRSEQQRSPQAVVTEISARPLRIGIVDLSILNQSHSAQNILPNVPSGKITLFYYGLTPAPPPDWPALAVSRPLSQSTLIADMIQDQLDIIVILHNVPGEFLLPILLARPAKRLASWWPDPATLGPGCLDAALVAPEEITPLRTGLSFEPLIPLATNGADPSSDFVRAMQSILSPLW